MLANAAIRVEDIAIMHSGMHKVAVWNCTTVVRDTLFEKLFIVKSMQFQWQILKSTLNDAKLYILKCNIKS